MARTAYWIAHATSGWTGTPTGAQIAAGDQSDNSNAAFSGYEAFTETAGTGTITEATATSGATAGISYTVAWVIYDDVEANYSEVETGTFRTSYSLTSSAGTFSYTGGTAGLAFNRVLIASGGTFSYTGGDATLTYTPASGDDYTLSAAGGTFSYSSEATGLAFNRVLVAASGTFSYSGDAASFSRGRILSAAGGTFAYIGGDASFLRTYVLSAEGGSFSLAGGDATFTYSGAPVEPPKQTGGGKSRKPRKRRYQVEIDGEVHEVESLQEAEAVLAEAAQKATETAKLAIERAAKAKRRPVRKIVRDAEKALEVPAVSVPPSLQSYADQMIGQIRSEYQSALSAIEIAAHMARREREIEEDDEEVLMLL